MASALENYHLKYHHACLVNKTSTNPTRCCPNWLVPLKDSIDQGNNDRAIMIEQQ